MKHVGIILALVLLLVGGYMFMNKSKQMGNNLSGVATDGKIDDNESVKIKAAVARIIQIPQEDPVMALVTNADSLIKEQPFYAGVTNGDVLLIFPQTGKAIIYSIKQDKLINVGPIQVGDSAKTPATTPVVTPPAETTTQ